MKELTLQELKDIEFDILKTFHAFCVENNIRYYISHGTLLGTIRYKGFIPWDDDVDVLVPREDYEKLLSLFKDNEKYRLFAYEKDKRYLFPYAKLCDMTTRKIEDVKDTGLALGVDMDIFPLDAWGDDIEAAKKDVKKIRKTMFRLGLSKLNKVQASNPIKQIVKVFLLAFCKMVGTEYFVEKLIKESKKHPYEGSAYLGDKAWCVYGNRDIIPAEVFAEAIEVEFEGEKFFAPVGYDAYLTSLYGDYLPEPPKEKQKTHHNFKAYRL